MNNDIFWAAFEDEIEKIASVKSTVKGVGLTAAALAALAGGGRAGASPLKLNAKHKHIAPVNMPLKAHQNKSVDARYKTTTADEYKFLGPTERRQTLRGPMDVYREWGHVPGARAGMPLREKDVQKATKPGTRPFRPHPMDNIVRPHYGPPSWRSAATEWRERTERRPPRGDYMKDRFFLRPDRPSKKK